jgi:hypothetical protein
VGLSHSTQVRNPSSMASASKGRAFGSMVLSVTK